MSEYPRTKPRNVSERVYRALLRAYPRNFCDEFGDAMVEFHRDRISHARLESRLLGAARVWVHVAADLLLNALPARLDALRRHNRNRLADERLLEEAARRPAADSDDERRRYYRLTPFGRRVVAAEAARLRALVRLAETARLLQPEPAR